MLLCWQIIAGILYQGMHAPLSVPVLSDMEAHTHSFSQVQETRLW